MDTKDTTIISFRVSPEELETLDTGAAKAGTSRADYVRTRLFASGNDDRVAQLEQQLHELTDHLGRLAENQKAGKCTDPEHARIYGVGHCFICDLPIKSNH